MLPNIKIAQAVIITLDINYTKFQFSDQNTVRTVIYQRQFTSQNLLLGK